jgi:glycosyltransferase involved in cell wall biosynthesis
MKTLSIVIPAYNEAAFIGTLLKAIVEVPVEELGYTKEIIVVDDGSKDATAEIARGIPGVRVFVQVPNQGKGAAVQRGVREATGDYILVQDADLEYSPSDYLPMLRALNEAGGRAAIYGSRTWGQVRKRGWLTPFPGRHEQQGLGPWGAGVILSGWTYTLYGKWISDTLTAYKLYPRNVLQGFHIETKGFETDHEITSKLIRAGIPIVEVPIEYRPRSVEEGKKIGPADGVRAVWTLLKYRFSGSR